MIIISNIKPQPGCLKHNLCSLFGYKVKILGCKIVGNNGIDPARTTLTGHSYGGYWGMYTLMHSDTIGRNTFANYYIGSPSFQANTNSASFSNFDDWRYERNKERNCNLYVTVGGNEEAPFIAMIERNIEKMKQHSYQGLSLEYEMIEGYDHNTVFKPSIRNTLKKYYRLK